MNTQRNIAVNFLHVGGKMVWGAHTRRFLASVEGLCDAGTCDELTDTTQLSLNIGDVEIDVSTAQV